MSAAEAPAEKPRRLQSVSPDAAAAFDEVGGIENDRRGIGRSRSEELRVHGPALIADGQVIDDAAAIRGPAVFVPLRQLFWG